MNNTVVVARRMGRVRALAACAFLAPIAASADPAPSFERIDLALGEPADHIVLPGRFRGGATDDLAVVTVNEDNQRGLSIHSIAGEPGQRTWRLSHRQRLDEDVVFMDVVGLTDGTERLLVGRRGRLSWLDAASGVEHPFLDLPSIYNVAPLDEVPRVEVARDVTGDGLDDIALADFDGYWLVRQRKDGSWHEPDKVAVTAGVSAGFAWSYRPRSAYPIDFNGDGLTDIAFWDRGELLVHLASDNGYADQPLVADLGLELEKDERIVSVAMGEDTEAEILTFWGMEDYNGDGTPDIATQRVTSSGLLSKKTTYLVHFGTHEDGVTTFRRTPDATFVSDGIQAMDTIDVDGDGIQEFTIITVQVSVARIIAALITGSVPFDAQMYAFTNGAYPEEPSFSRRFHFDFSLRTGSISSPDATFADVTGDGIKDAVLINTDDGLVVHPGTGGATVIAEQGHEIEFTTLHEAVSVEERDFDDDGRDDLFIRTGLGQDPKGVVVLLSRE